MKRTITILFTIMSFINCSAQNKTDQTPVENFDLNQYLGLWHEIARYENRFEGGLDNVTAMYKLMPDGKVQVINSGYKDGKLKQSIGKAKIGKRPTQGYLKVSFFFNIYSPYRVVMLADDYSYAVVTGGDKYLWILARKQCLDVETLNSILDEITKKGFYTKKLLFNKR